MRIQTEKENWDQFWTSNTESRFTKKSWSKIRIMALLDEILKPGMKVLDAGCGSGFFSQYFITRDCEVYTLDYSDSALEVAKKKTANKSKAYLKENLLASDFGLRYANTFDIIFTDGLFEHFTKEDQDKILNNFKASKKNTGIITTFVPNKYSWWEIIRPLVMPGIHEEAFTLKQLKELHHGLEILKEGGINVLPMRFSPDRSLGSALGMIVYCFAR
jgi:cyclopropane fatty-acyl-phospholipid synthase-like methyltransferase